MHHQCEYPEISGYGTVLVNISTNLCEVGCDCKAKKCAFSFTEADVKPCPTCKGDIRAITEPPYTCETCDIFGKVRV